MDLAKKLFLLLIVGLAVMPVAANAAPRMVIGEYITNWS